MSERPPYQHAVEWRLWSEYRIDFLGTISEFGFRPEDARIAFTEGDLEYILDQLRLWERKHGEEEKPWI